MKIDFAKFNGTLPYASELFGVFQPLLGWRSRRTKERLASSTNSFRDSLISYVSSKIYPDVRLKEGDRNAVSIDRLGVGSMEVKQRSGVSPQIDCLLSRAILNTIEKEKLDLSDDAVWKRLLSPDSLRKTLDAVKDKIIADPVAVRAVGNKRMAELSFAGAVPHTPVMMQQLAARESVVAGVLGFLYKNKMLSELRALFAGATANVDLAAFEAMKPLIDPLAAFDPKNDMPRVSLSPIGIVHLFRQYFFEFDTFLGPSVQHIWLSPGATVELIEIHTRKTVTERYTEQASEVLTKEEKSLAESDEISDAVKKENAESTKLGVSASADAGVNYEAFTAHASVSANFGYDTNEKKAREQIHKQTRQQTAKLSSEIKRNYKSTFKTITEIQDTSSKRYVLTNQSDQLTNYELRRKMRQVGVQLQDLGTKLCWQTYVDDPGREIGVALLAHIAEPPDLSNLKQPEAPTDLQTAYVDLQIAFPYENTSDSDEKDVTFYKGSDQESWPDHNDTIVWIREYQADPPDHGYKLHENIDVTPLHSSTCVAIPKKLSDDGKFQISLDQVNFDNQSSINLKVRLRWEPPDQSAAAAKFLTDQANFDREKERLTKETYISAARERIKLASNIEPRSASELREEERIVVFRNLIGALLNVGVNLENARTRHITAELISAMFDVDSMLYFVAPDWWRPRLHESHQSFGSSDAQGKASDTTRITEENVVSWGGAKEGRRDNYYITDESKPAKLGSSLGWLLQLDGDNLRNAFLNAPWVKVVVPIRPGRELAALNWLSNAAIEGTDGLDAKYQPADDQEAQTIAQFLKQFPWSEAADRQRYGRGFGAGDITISDALKYLALFVRGKGEQANVKKQENVDGELRSYLPTDKVYEHGFYPLQGGFQAQSNEPFAVFDQWVEVLPTDQIVAVEVKYDPKTGLQI